MSGREGDGLTGLGGGIGIGFDGGFGLGIRCSGGIGTLGDRRGPAGDRSAVRDLLVRLASLAGAGLGIHELEINPLIVGAEGEGAIAVDALVTVDGR